MRINRNKFCAPLLIVALLLAHTACFFGKGSATDQFARANYEISVYVGEALKVTDALLDDGAITPDQAIAAVGAIRAINLAHKKVLTEAVQYLQVGADGKEVLVLTREGQLRFNDLLGSLFVVATGVVNDPAILKLNSNARTRVTAVLLALAPVVSKLVGLVKKLPVLQRDAPPLRLQIPAATAQRFRLLIPQLDALDRLAAQIH